MLSIPVFSRIRKEDWYQTKVHLGLLMIFLKESTKCVWYLHSGLSFFWEPSLELRCWLETWENALCISMIHKWWWWLCWWSWWWWWICWFSRLLMRLKFFVYTDIDYDHGTNEYHFHSISFGRSCSAWFYIWGLVFFQDEILSKISCYIVVKPYEILQDQFDYKVQWIFFTTNNIESFHP